MASNLSNSDSEVDLPAPRRSTSREFVWLETKTKSIPSGRAWDKLNRDGRVKELTFFGAVDECENSSKVASLYLEEKIYQG